MKKANITVEKRTESGKGVARRLRRAGRIPAVLYGRGSEPLALSVDQKEFVNILHGQESRNTLISIQMANGGDEEILSLPKEIQFDPVRGDVIHVDFQMIHLNEPIHTQVPLHLTGSSPGVKKGGVLEHLMREIDVACLPMDIPDHIEVDISGMEVGDSLNVSQLQVSEKFKILSDGNRTLVLVAAPTVEQVPEEEVAAAEGEAEPGAEETPPEGEKSE